MSGVGLLEVSEVMECSILNFYSLLIKSYMYLDLKQGCFQLWMSNAMKSTSVILFTVFIQG